MTISHPHLDLADMLVGTNFFQRQLPGPQKPLREFAGFFRYTVRIVIPSRAIERCKDRIFSEFHIFVSGSLFGCVR